MIFNMYASDLKEYIHHHTAATLRRTALHKNNKGKNQRYSAKELHCSRITPNFIMFS
jgi:hypothetical protein